MNGSLGRRSARHPNFGSYPSLYLHPSRRISTCYPLLKLRVAVEIPAFRSATPEEAPLAFLERLRVDSTSLLRTLSRVGLPGAR